MPLHRVNRLGNLSPAEELAAAVKRLENDGETVVQVLDHGNEWLLVTAATKRPAKRVETRA